MDRESIRKYLASTDLFQSFTEEDLLRFADDTKEIRYSAGQYIFQEGDQGQDMFVLLEGIVEVSKNRRFITQIEPIDYVGEMSLLENKPRSATATAKTAVHLLQITATQFEKYLTKQPQSLVAMMKTMSTRVRHDTELIAQEFQKANILIHDMRNRLSAFLLLNLIKDPELSDKSKHYLELMDSSCSDLSAMMDEALANAKRLEYRPSLQATSIPHLVTDLLQTEFLMHKALQGITLHCDIPADLPSIVCTPNDIRRVITNLVVNAGQASPIGAQVSIAAHFKENRISISVADSGCGVPDSLREKIFEPHFSTKEDGNGFGLASCKDIVERKYHGQISMQSNNEGTIFSFSLPVTQDNLTN